MSKTIVYAAETEKGHVLGYQNVASTDETNGMLIALPAAHPLAAEHGIDARAFPSLLADLRELTTPRSRGMLSYGGASRGVDLFDVGSYSVLSTDDPTKLADHIERLPEAKRPRPNPAIYESFARWYPGWQFALCCWNGSIEAEPLIWRYTSLRPDYLYLPGLDAHDGRTPRLDARVGRDHHLIWGSWMRKHDGHYGGVGTASVRNALPDAARELVPSVVHGKSVKGEGANGDWWLLLDRLDVAPAVEAPPGSV
jgi:hypothetical protein